MNQRLEEARKGSGRGKGRRESVYTEIYGIWKSKKCQSGEINTRRQQHFF